MSKKKLNKSLTIRRTPFIDNLLNSDNISNKVKKSIVNFIDTTQNITIDKLMQIHSEIVAELPEDDYLNPNAENVHINAIMLTIIQDEFKDRGGNA